MRAYDIVGDKIEFTPEFLAVPENKVIWDRDKTKGKHKAFKELSFIVFLCDERTHNPYISYSEDLREEVLKVDFFKDRDIELDSDIKAAIKKLRKLLETTGMRLVVSAQVAADKLADWYRKFDLEEYYDDGKPKYNVNDLSRNLKDVGNILKNLKELERQLRLEQSEDSVARGGSEIGLYEIPR